MVEVFKTNVQTYEDSNAILQKLLVLFPMYAMNFDLEDCDRILRIEYSQGKMDISKVKQLIESFGFEIEIL